MALSISPNPRPTTAVIPAAGLGTRLRTLTRGLPKEMLPVGGQIALVRIVSELRAAGIQRILFVLSPPKEALVRHCFGSEDDGVRFEYVLQGEMRGLGDAVLCAAPRLEEPSFLVALGDALFEEAQTGAISSRLCDSCATAGASVGIVVRRVRWDMVSRYGIVRPVRAAPVVPSAHFWEIDDMVEKPDPDDAPSEYAVAARYVVPYTLLDTLRQTAPGVGGEIQLTDALRSLLREGYPGIAVPLLPGEVRHDIGGLESYYRAFATFALADPERGAAFRTWLMSRLQSDILSDEEKPLE